MKHLKLLYCVGPKYKLQKWEKKNNLLLPIITILCSKVLASYIKSKNSLVFLEYSKMISIPLTFIVENTVNLINWSIVNVKEMRIIRCTLRIPKNYSIKSALEKKKKKKKGFLVDLLENNYVPS